MQNECDQKQVTNDVGVLRIGLHRLKDWKEVRLILLISNRTVCALAATCLLHQYRDYYCQWLSAGFCMRYISNTHVLCVQGTCTGLQTSHTVLSPDYSCNQYPILGNAHSYLCMEYLLSQNYKFVIYYKYTLPDLKLPIPASHKL